MTVWIVEEFDCGGCGTFVGVFASALGAEAAKRAHAEESAQRSKTEHAEYLKRPIVTFVLHGPNWRPMTPDEVYERRLSRCLSETTVSEREVLP